MQLNAGVPLFGTLSFIAGGISNFGFWKVFTEVHETLPVERLPWTIGKSSRVWRAHRDLKPDSPWRKVWAVGLLVAVVAALGCMFSFWLSIPH